MKGSRGVTGASREHRRSAFALGLATLMLTACGGGGSSDGVPDALAPGDTDAPPLIPGEGSGVPAATAKTVDIQRSAAAGAGRGVDVNAGSLQRVLDDSAVVGAGLGIAQGAVGSGDTVSNGDVGDLFGPDGTPDFLAGDMSAEFGRLLDASLGLRGPAATLERTGDRITIDPDETALCEEDLLGLNATQDDFDRCTALMADLVVQIDAASEDTGVTTYRFRDEPVLSIGYSPMAASYELKLEGLGTLLARVEELEGGSVEDLPSVLQGALRLVVVADSDVPGAEAGTVELQVSEALRVVDDTDGTDLELAPSTLLTVRSDAGAGTASLETDIGALRATFPDDDDFGNPSLLTLAMSGATARIDLTENGDVLEVSGLGLRQGPLTLSVDSTEVVRLVMDTFGFSVDADTGRIDIAGDMDIALDVDDMLGMFDELGSNLSLSLGLAAPGGTSLLGLDSGALQVISGGPLQVGIDLLDDETAVNDDVTVPAGQCVGLDPSGIGLIAAVDCQ